MIHTDRSRLREQTRALVELLQSSIGQLRRNTIHMFYRQGFWGEAVNTSKRQPPHPPSTAAVLPSSDPVPADRAIPSLHTECLTVVVNVLGGAVKVYTRRFQGMTCAVAGQLPQPGRVWGPVGKDSSPGYSWLNRRQTAGTDED